MMNLGNRVLGYATCKLVVSQAIPNMRLIEINSLHTNEHHRRKGWATKLINKICDEADEVGVGLLLMPDTAELQTWYTTLGFQTLQEKPVILMARPPKGKFE